MAIKFVFLACVMVYLCGRASAGKLRNQLLDEVCKESSLRECREKANKCMAPHLEPTPEERKQWHTEYCKIFRTCTEKLPKVKNAYHAFVKEKRDGKDWCSEGHSDNDQHHKEHHEEKKVYFPEYLSQVAGPEEAAKFQCCLAKEKGKFDAHGKVIVDAWKKGAAKIVDPAAKSAYEKGIAHCAAANPICSIHDFKICALKKCIHEIK